MTTSLRDEAKRLADEYANAFAGRNEYDAGAKSMSALHAIIDRLSDLAERAETLQQTVQCYERDYILPCFKWASEVGFDLPDAVRSNAGKNCVQLLVEHLRRAGEVQAKLSAIPEAPAPACIFGDSAEACCGEQPCAAKLAVERAEAPAPSEAALLTDMEIHQLWLDAQPPGSKHLPFARAIERAVRAAPEAPAVPAPQEPTIEELRRAVALIGVVGQIDGHDVIRRESVLDIIDRRRHG